MGTNIELLHKQFYDPRIWWERRSGKTTVLIHNLAGLVKTAKAPEGRC